MALNSIQVNTSAAVAGLGTTTFNVVSAGEYKVECKSFIPLNSALQIIIKLNGSAQVTVGGAAANPTPTQQIMSAGAILLCAASDVITVVLSSANAVDNVPNSVKSVINLFQGE